MATTKDDLETLEQLVDRCGLETVLYMLGDICADKAEHLTTNWQDKTSARHWATACIKITRTADAVRSLECVPTWLAKESD